MAPILPSSSDQAFYTWLFWETLSPLLQASWDPHEHGQLKDDLLSNNDEAPPISVWFQQLFSSVDQVMHKISGEL